MKKKINIIFHVGMPKCGSSALQVFLSSYRLIHNQNEYLYVAINSDGEILYGEKLFRIASNSSFRYITSSPADVINKLSQEAIQRATKELIYLGKKYDALILSNEGWGQSPEAFSKIALFSNSSFNISVLAFLRPQIEWFNSAWWQWGTWSSVGFDRWIEANKSSANWFALKQKWEEIPWVNLVTFRITEYDNVEGFLRYYSLSIKGKNDVKTRVNESLPEILLKLFKRNPKLRPGPHDSAIDFILRRALKLSSAPTPWVINQPWIQTLLEFYKEDNLKLCSVLDKNQRELMLNDPSWWSAGHYLNRPLCSFENYDLDASNLENLAISAIEAIIEQEQRIQYLQSQLGSNNLDF